MPATPVASIDDYIAGFPAEVRTLLERVRSAVHDAAPGAQELISYKIPAFRQGEVLVYFGAFKHHIGFYPPVRGNAALVAASAAYAGEKGNLRFRFDQPLPLDLIQRITRWRLRQADANGVGRRGKKGA